MLAKHTYINQYTIRIVIFTEDDLKSGRFSMKIGSLQKPIISYMFLHCSFSFCRITFSGIFCQDLLNLNEFNSYSMFDPCIIYNSLENL